MLGVEFYRRCAHLTQAQLGEKVGEKQIRISEVERGLRPTPALLRSLAHVFGVPEAAAETLLREVDPDVAGVPPPPSLEAAIREHRK